MSTLHTRIVRRVRKLMVGRTVRGDGSGVGNWGASAVIVIIS